MSNTKSCLSNETSPDKIYSYILAEVDELISSFENQEEDEELRKAREEALKRLKVSQKEIQDSILELDKNAEWKTFTIAFYGETNAGKSMLIETLRILLMEPKKTMERREFNRLFKEYNAIKDEIKERQKSFNDGEDDYNKEIINNNNESQAVNDQLQSNIREIESLKNQIAELKDTTERKKKSPIFNIILYIFKKLPSQVRARECEKELNEKENDIPLLTNRKNELKKKKDELRKVFSRQRREHEEKLEQLNNKAKTYPKKLKKKADGQIIGDGSSDFTQDVSDYRFTVKNQDFSLLDLPGIHGNEEPVLKKINDAVQKAHAVFYVTDKTTPLQTGDVEGTLEKIKKHLGQQTEVFTIYNKRINNPNLLGEKLVNDKDINDLGILDDTMKTLFGKHYQGYKSVSAKPAFLSKANCWQDDHEADKKKFIKHFKSSRRLMEKTGVEPFAQWLTTDIVKNCEAKIKRSNFRKAITVLNHTINNIRQIKENCIERQQMLIENKEKTDNQLDESLAKVEDHLAVDGHTAIEEFKDNVQYRIYKDIEGNISNDKFKNALDEYTKEGLKEFGEKLNKKLKKEIDDFRDEVSKIANKYQEYAEELLGDSTANLFDENFRINIKISGKLKYLVRDAILIISGIILTILSPAGWIVVAVSLIDALLNAAKLVAGVVNPAYRKSQLRKAAVEYLGEMETKILNSIRKDLANTHESLYSGIDNIKNDLTKTISCIKVIVTIHENAEIRLVKLALKIKKEGDQ